MKKLLTIIAASTIITGFSVAQGAPLPIEGNWGMHQSQGPFNFDINFAIQNNTITVTNVCTFQGKTAAAHVSSPAQYDDQTITVTEHAEDHESKDGVNCDISLTPDRMNYQVEGSSLILSHDGSSDQIQLTRK